jgi:uncharacterized membrane protein
MLLGFLGVPVLAAKGILLPLWLGILLNIPLVVDGYSQRRGWRVSNNTLRLVTGVVSGFGLSILAVTGAVLLGKLLMSWK